MSENFREYYDYNGNRAAIEKYSRHTGKIVRSIINIDKKEATIIHSGKLANPLDLQYCKIHFFHKVFILA